MFIEVYSFYVELEKHILLLFLFFFIEYIPKRNSCEDSMVAISAKNFHICSLLFGTENEH